MCVLYDHINISHVGGLLMVYVYSIAKFNGLKGYNIYHKYPKSSKWTLSKVICKLCIYGKIHEGYH